MHRFASVLLASLRAYVVLITVSLSACESESTGREEEPVELPVRDAATRGKDAAAPAKDAAMPTKDASTSSTKSGALDGGDAVVADAASPRTVHADAPGFCHRPGADAIRDAFCFTPPDIRSLRDLQNALSLKAYAQDDPEYVDVFNDPFGSGVGVVLLGHSTALPGRLISPINPRAILIGRLSAMAFQRGVQSIEMASRARDGDGFNFYLLTFQQACNESSEGCSPGDLYTPKVERDWLSVQIVDDEDLKNSPSDCRQCHRRARESSMLLMRELDSPWTHFFEPLLDEAAPTEAPGVRGHDLVKDYLRAKGDEPYGGLSPSVIRGTIGLALENAVLRDQPLLFDAPRVEDDRWPYGPDGWPSEPKRSEWWDNSFAAFQRGEELALPHYDPRPTDPRKQQALTEAYQRYLSGELPASELPDLADIFSDDPQVRAEIGLETTPGATPAQVLIQACGTCHNDVLDQSISRARFTIDLARLDAAQVTRAIERLELPPEAEGVMPPREARQVPAAAKAALLRYLREGKRTAEDDALLARAAKLGMTGGARAPRADDDGRP